MEWVVSLNEKWSKKKALCVKNKNKILTMKNKVNKEYIFLLLFIFKIIWIFNIPFINPSSCCKKFQQLLHTTFVINFTIKNLILVNTFTEKCQFLPAPPPPYSFLLNLSHSFRHVGAYDKWYLSHTLSYQWH